MAAKIQYFNIKKSMINYMHMDEEGESKSISITI